MGLRVRVGAGRGGEHSLACFDDQFVRLLDFFHAELELSPEIPGWGGGEGGGGRGLDRNSI